MPIIIPQDLPAVEILTSENIFVINEARAEQQDIRPLRIAIMNLMPTKIKTETQLLRLLANMPLQVEVELLCTASYQPKNTPQDHLEAFYKNFDQINHEKFDGMIITGAPVETLPFEEVEYWEELKQVMDWAKKHVFSTMYICWGAQAGLYHLYGVPKYQLERKMFGVFEHTLSVQSNNLLRGFDDVFFAPHSRWTEVRREDIEKVPQLEILAESDKAGVYIAASRDGRSVFVTGHSEYDPETLKGEYDRDIALGLDINLPENYYRDDDPQKEPIVRWRSHANLLFANWLNYCVYQETPYNLDEIGK